MVRRPPGSEPELVKIIKTDITTTYLSNRVPVCSISKLSMEKFQNGPLRHWKNQCIFLVFGGFQKHQYSSNLDHISTFGWTTQTFFWVCDRSRPGQLWLAQATLEMYQNLQNLHFRTFYCNYLYSTIELCYSATRVCFHFSVKAL